MHISHRILVLLLLGAASALLLSGCGVAKVVSELVTGDASSPQGPQVPQVQQVINLPSPTTDIPLTIETSATLNRSNQTGRANSVQVLVLRLRDPNKFLTSPYSNFTDEAKLKSYLEDDLIASKSMMVLPSKIYTSKEKLSNDVSYLGIVALFLTPHSKRWRMAFPVAGKEKNGEISLALNKCNIATRKGVPLQLSSQPVSAAALAQEVVQCP